MCTCRICHLFLCLPSGWLLPTNLREQWKRQHGTDKIHLLLLNDYPPDEIERALEAAKKSNGRKKEKRSTFKSVVKLPFVHDRLARDVSRVVRRQFKDVRVVFTSGPSLRDMLVRSSSCPFVCPREKRRLSQKKEKGRPPECRACDAGMSHRKCVLKGVVYSMRCTVCDDLYIGETGNPARERFAEHYRDTKRRDVRTAWGSHCIDRRESATTSPEFAPFHKAQILGRQSSLPSRRLLEATEIARHGPEVNRDNGWRLMY